MKCAFTICTYSYTGLANVLKQTFLKYNQGYDFYVVYIDKKSDEKNVILADDILIKYVSYVKIKDMQYKYDVTEYSTSIKSFAFKYFFEKEYAQVLYFDPDIMVFSEFKELNDQSFDAYVTPHKVIMKGIDGVEEEANVLKHGLFNCGFIGFNQSKLTMLFLNWWCDRLKDYAFNDLQFGVYTDQKWVDYITIFMGEKVHIINNLGCNFAPWNMDERILKKDNGIFKVVNVTNTEDKYILVFIHFSGFDYKKLQDGVISHNFRSFPDYIDLKGVLIEYGKKLRNEKTNMYLKQNYKYNYYENGDLISKFNRRLYRSLNETENYKNPFAINSEIYLLMKKNKLIVYQNIEAKRKNIKSIGKKKKAVIVLFRLFKKILGIEKYTELLRAFQLFSYYDKQEFLVKKDIK